MNSPDNWIGIQVTDRLKFRRLVNEFNQEYMPKEFRNPPRIVKYNYVTTKGRKGASGKREWRAIVYLRFNDDAFDFGLLCAKHLPL